MKLYYSPGSCSLSPHIILREAGFEFTTEKVDLKAKKTETGQDFNAINEKSSVPVLVLDNGETLTEGVAIVQYLADQKPEAKLAPANGTLARTRVQEWLNYITTELHKGFTPLFRAADYGPQAGEYARERLKKQFDYISRKLDGKEYLAGNAFTVADAYLFTVLGWTKHVGLSLAEWPALDTYCARIAARPHVQAAMKAEGLLAA